jgi:hypothetical protein
MRRRIIIALTIASMFIGAGIVTPVFSQSRSAKTRDYPSLSDKELGHVRWMVKIAMQPLGDWANMGGLEEGQEGLEAYRYQLGFMAYVLALAQYHKTPAYRELYQVAMDNLIRKMIRRDVWYYWEHTSKGSKMMNPALKEKGPGWVDPVVEKNIMYSGHLINMLELYQMLYRDNKYDKPESVTFRWAVGMDDPKLFQYDGNKLAAVIHKQFMENPLHMIECEINMAFPVCNQHPLLGLILYDHNHGTKLSMAARELMLKTFTEKKLLDPESRDFMQFFMVEQGMPVGPASPGNNAIVGMLMHAWSPTLVENLYRTHAGKVDFAADGTASVKGDSTVGMTSAAAFAAYAKEIGDQKTAEGLIAWMEKNCSPEWIAGKYRYPRNDDKKITPLFGVMAAIADLNVKNGILSIYSQPWNESRFRQPFVSGVEYPRAVVSQAYYDEKKDVLAVMLVSGEGGGRTTSFAVNQLDKSKTYSISKDGQIAGYLRKGLFEPARGAKGIEFDDQGILRISTDLSKAQSFMIEARQ